MSALSDSEIQAITELAMGNAYALACVVGGLRHAGMVDPSVVATYARAALGVLSDTQPVAANVLEVFVKGLGIEGGASA